jgi:hypothetical protein
MARYWSSPLDQVARSEGQGGVSRRGRRCLICSLSKACAPAAASGGVARFVAAARRRPGAGAARSQRHRRTTLINSIVGITALRRHHYSWRARHHADAPGSRARAIGWVPQEHNIFRSLTVEENMTAVAQPGPWTAKVYQMFPRLRNAAQLATSSPAASSRCWRLAAR